MAIHPAAPRLHLPHNFLIRPGKTYSEWLSSLVQFNQARMLTGCGKHMIFLHANLVPAVVWEHCDTVLIGDFRKLKEGKAREFQAHVSSLSDFQRWLDMAPTAKVLTEGLVRYVEITQDDLGIFRLLFG